MLLVLAVAALAQKTALPVPVAERTILLGAMSSWEVHIAKTPSMAAHLPALKTLETRMKQAKDLETFRIVQADYEKWRQQRASEMAPGGYAAYLPGSELALAQAGAFEDLAVARRRAVDAQEVKKIDGLRQKVALASDPKSVDHLFDNAGRYRAMPVASAGSAFSNLVYTGFKSQVNTAQTSLGSPKDIGDRAAQVPPPTMVSGRQEPSYKKLVAYLTDVAHRSGLYQKLVGLGVDPLPFMLALVKSESNFQQRAVSPAAAYGYMQVLVPTAKGVLAKNKAFYQEMTGEKLNTGAISGQSLLDNWKMNVIAGTLFLKEQVERFDGLVEKLPTAEQQGKMLINLIASAYNAGPGAVAAYLTGQRPSQVSAAELRGIEDNAQAQQKVAAATAEKSVVPYRETRGYVAKIQNWYETWRTSWSSWADLRGASTPAA